MTAKPSLFDTPAQARRRRWRLAKDRLARYGVGVGGISVIIAIVLIFFYLFYVVFPLFVPAGMDKLAEYPVAGGGQTLHLAIEELNEQAVRYTDDGHAVFFALKDGRVIDEQALSGTDGHAITSQALGTIGSGRLALGLDDGSAVLLQHQFKVSFPDNVRTITPHLVYPYGETPQVLDDQGQALTRLAMRDAEERLVIVALTADGRLLLADYTKETSFLSDEVSLERSLSELGGVDIRPDYLLIDPSQQHLYLAARDGQLLHYTIRAGAAPRLLERVQLTAKGRELTSLRFLLGGISLLVGDSQGGISQWFPVRDQNNQSRLVNVRQFASQQAAILDLDAEERRKGFLAVDADGNLGIYHSTAERTLLVEHIADSPLRRVAISPRSDYLLAEDEGGRLQFWQVHNEHPEISWHSLWEKVHYEGYAEPKYIWQSSSASNDFEPKFSLTPLSFGTLKAAFYAMLFAVPLAIMGAIYTAYFMAPRMRQLVKPTIEIMEALPTVILGFLAGLWLAPTIENYLPGVFGLLIFFPIGIILFAYFWQRLPRRAQRLVPEGWEGALLIPVILLIGWAGMVLSEPLELWLFDGNMRGWLHNELGIGFDQRNSIVVGLAMGFAVIPTIFSITEDAIFSVPKHLTFGSLALGASPWQTLSRVVILTASPGIFSAVMIGLGRAVGETMIVLMATGNTPVMDMSIFQGMRTLSANIAVEMPESEVASSHYRVLFLAALVLFMFTFVFNTLAEVIRQRLRKKYASL